MLIGDPVPSSSFVAVRGGASSDNSVTANAGAPQHVNASYPIEEKIITPPSSTVRKQQKKTVDTLEFQDLLHPLSPAHSSPIAPSRAKRQRSDGCSRANGNLSLSEILSTLANKKQGDFTDKKPPYSYAVLICLAILQSAEGKLTLSQIYNWITTQFPFYKLKDSSWQNSIRHNLSLNEAFIKTDKSCDGKGHFWEVKPESAPKFFKGETADYNEIRQKLVSLDLNTHEDTGTVSNGVILNSTLNAKPQQQMAVINSSPNNEAMISHDDTDVENSPAGKVPRIEISNPFNGRVNGLLRSFQNNDILSLNQQANPSRLDPPYLMKRTHTAIGLQNIPFSGLTTEPVVPSHDFTPGLHDIHNGNELKSPQNLKRYICSFNSSFEMSPRGSKPDSASFIETFEDVLGGSTPSKSNSAGSNSSKLHSVMDTNEFEATPGAVSRPSGAGSHPQPSLLAIPNPNEILQTPELKRSHSMDKTPIRFANATPRDTHDSCFKKWQTPSHLFEDIYLSPIFKAMGKSGKVTATPGGTITKSLSPRKLSAPTLTHAEDHGIKSKLPSAGLFGVDVYSVWKRATGNVKETQNNKTTDSQANRETSGEGGSLNC
ncbi:Hcm1p KNAG_0I02890 [Huiozyma naganishii CBS 8797]|uniref:Fork-head domain-containing protein n=1 Tax=Huiozyma naganishii (strain ATCC MYA-139 / BCRC 22969 / CBS 8797 / KCTC 17520 / NBRC 10181 / NCYC 3082 / Yp74L-3) TaxID=1071383 RepID=J7RQL0_HUIN7|nr:hypothetical protein KNAG_0I02890 [Kazachstania naganishii CBS 8797]CCK72073.1 hypothetical protein KNAG_0I02890 [Kazachstania naganishii CBS 8797]